MSAKRKTESSKTEAASEPIRAPALAIAFAEVVILLLLAFGLNLDAEAIAALTSALIMLGSVAIWLIARDRAWSPKSVELVTGKGIQEASYLLEHKKKVAASD